MAKKLTLLEKIASVLHSNGVSERKSKELAKAITPVARNAAKKELEIKANPPEVKESPKAGAKYKFALLTNLPVVPMRGEKGLGLLRVMDGLYSSKTYITAAVKGENGIVAVRDLGSIFNVKFYPDMEFWGYSERVLSGLGAVDHLKREHYERMHFPQEALDQLLARIEASKPKSRVKKLINQIKALAFKPLLSAFAQLKEWRHSSY
jgi:hypothetical protein